MGSNKPIIAAGCFLTSAINIYKYFAGCRKKRGSSAFRLILAALGVLIGTLSLLSYRVDRAHMKAREAKDGCDLDHWSLEEDIPDDVTVCFDDCAEWERV